MNRLKVEFLRKVSQYFDTCDFEYKNKNICVCLSGGADSVALLCALDSISPKYGFTVSACHFNHQIRDVDADNDESFCKELCDKMQIKLYCGRDDVPEYAKLHKMSIEEAARKCRYAFFERVYSKESVDYCATAHNMNDDAETLLLNLMRGSGNNGSSAISPRNKNIIRPFLKIQRSEIEEFLTAIKQNHITDLTNFDDVYTRNYIRHTVLPTMEKVNPSVIDALSRYIESCRNDRNYFDLIIAEYADKDLRTLHKSVRSRIIIKKFKDFTGASLSFSNINDIDSAIFSEKRIILPVNHTYDVIINNGQIDFYHKIDNTKFIFEPSVLNMGVNDIFAERVMINISSSESKNIEFFNKIAISEIISFDNIKGSLRVRNRITGDKICIRGINRSLKKLFIDNKIPKEYRDIIPIIFDDEGIIYVPFIGISDRVKPTSQSNNKTITTIFNTIDPERWKNAYEE